jgi:hypothetical protein
MFQRLGFLVFRNAVLVQMIALVPLNSLSFVFVDRGTICRMNVSAFSLSRCVYL